MSNPGGRSSPMTGENSPREETAAFFAQSDLYSQMRDVFTAANRNNAAIYSLDPRGLTPFEFGIDEAVGPNQDRRTLQMTQDTLRSLADETDGRAIVNRNDLLPGLAQIVRDSSFYYLLGYNSTQAPSDGKFHQITVRLKRRGLDVRARKGYWALTAEDIRAPTRRRSKRRSPSSRRWRRSRRPSRRASTCAPGWAPRAASRARRVSRSSGSRCRSPRPPPRAAAARPDVAPRRRSEGRSRVPRPRARDGADRSAAHDGARHSGPDHSGSRLTPRLASSSCG